MAKTAAGAELTAAHHAAQLAVRAGSIANLIKLWQIVDPANLSGTIDVFVQAAVLLAGSGFDESAGTAARYYSLFRQVEGGARDNLPQRPGLARPPAADFANELRGAALKGILVARRAGLPVDRAKERGFVRAAGALAKLVLAGGRRTLVTLVRQDRTALGWARVTSDDPCAFCRMLASRGAVYKSEAGADFVPHDGCGCSPEPLFRGASPPEQAAEYAREWQAAQAQARTDGTMSRGTSNDALNNYRRYLAGEQATTA
ncbi:MAG: hypothetical protein ABW022_26125 [Actinoplanes sp.]